MRSAVFLSIREKATRLPGKVLLPLQGKTVTELLIERLQSAKRPDLVVLCTSTHPGDTVLVELAKRMGIAHFRGSENDKLDRYLAAAQEFKIDFMSIVDGDDLLCDPVFIDRGIKTFERTEADFITTKELPLGCASFGVKTRALETVMAIKSESDTEVWGAYFTETGLFKVQYVPVEPELQRPDIRLTLDYREDFEVFKRIFERLYKPGMIFTLHQVVELLTQHPEWLAINSKVQELYEKNLRKSAGVKLKPNYQDILKGRR